MHYMGGKSRISKPIAEIINSFAEGGGTFASLFCGACSVESKVKGYEHIILNDKQEYLIALLKAVQQGYIPPEEMTVDRICRVRLQLRRQVVWRLCRLCMGQKLHTKRKEHIVA